MSVSLSRQPKQPFNLLHMPFIRKIITMLIACSEIRIEKNCAQGLEYCPRPWYMVVEIKVMQIKERSFT